MKILENELVQKLKNRSNGAYHLYEIKDILELLKEEVKEQWLLGNDIELRTLGVFKTRHVPPRMLNDPQTSTLRLTGGYNKPCFIVSKDVYKKVRQESLYDN